MTTASLEAKSQDASHRSPREENGSLPDEVELERLEELRYELERLWPSDFPLHLAKMELRYEPKIYRFLSAFPEVGRKDLAELSLALRFLVYATLMTDKIVDSESRDRFEHDFFHIQAFQFECYGLLYRLFPPGSWFWQQFRGFFQEFIQACLDERRFARGELPWQGCTEDRALAIVHGKNRFSQLLVTSLAALTEDDSQLEALSESVEKHYCAWQLWDDLCDWKEDFKDGVPTVLLIRVLDELPEPQERPGLIPHLARTIYYEGHAVKTLEQAIALLDEAKQAVAHLPDLAWTRVVEELRLECVALRDDLGRIVAKNVKRAQEQKRFELGERDLRDGVEVTAWGALEFLVEQWHLGFGEAQHIAYMAHELGYRGETELPSGDVFQRALIADALCDADQWLHGRLRPVLESEARYLLSRRSESRVGGWRYFPSIPELAPDADDLGQVMQVLLRTGFRSEVEQYCESPLKIIRQDAARRNGLFSTWIIPSEDLDGLEQAQARLRGENWGPGPDEEVIANLLYALTLGYPERFVDLLEPGLDFLESRQDADGSWSAKWYFGPYYGTYVCLRLLCATRPLSETVYSAVSFLLAQQREDGGWGFGEDSDPLSTALALLGLACACIGPLDDIEWACRGLEYLGRRREADGGWPSVPFISIPEYGSRTVTTLYVLKACLACGPLRQGGAA